MMKASYTVEAALIMPLVILIVGLVIHTGIEKYKETLTLVEQCVEQAPEDVVKKVRLLLFCEDVLTELEGK